MNDTRRILASYCVLNVNRVVGSVKAIPFLDFAQNRNRCRLALHLVGLGDLKQFVLSCREIVLHRAQTLAAIAKYDPAKRRLPFCPPPSKPKQLAGKIAGLSRLQPVSK
jgi:hypothetical protein